KPLCFNNPFYYEADSLCREAFERVVSYIESADEQFVAEARKGKMFGVLVVENQEKNLGFLAAYSGQINSTFETDYFVPAIFDYLDEDGYFKVHEREISDINREISQKMDSLERKTLQLKFRMIEKTAEETLKSVKSEFAEAKQRRDEIRKQGNLTPETEQKLIRESQHQKAELNRIKQKLKASIAQADSELKAWDNNIQDLRNLRKQKSDELQRWLFSQFVIVNYLGERKNVLDIFSDFNGTIPPSGSGECCAPKLLQHAFLNGLKPISMAEFWYGESPRQEIRHHLNFYPACNGKCKPILNFMLRGLSYPANPLEITQKDGLETIYEDDAIIAVSKPEGMLSVPGKSDLKSAYDIVKEQHQDDEIWICHRLDMATSGILIFAKSKFCYEYIRGQFESHTVKKRYVAILDGKITEKKGKISLPLSPDLDDRPRQIVDRENGKFAITEFEVVSESANETKIYLYPHTGRTHQLRVHCAHYEGLNTPIKGDGLYGRKSDRLYLHAERITFVHPRTGKKITLEDAHNHKW
ncbi:MAG: pseudouridine synthase, partial [Bacteroidales bacterium]|nr:pseudouridine synthase [Bacteroidales bacterium]